MTGAGRRLQRLAAIDVAELHSVSPKKAAALRTMGIETVLDLLTTYPRRYIDRTRQADVADLAEGDEAVVLAEVTSTRSVRRGRPRVELSVHDTTGRLRVVFFHQLWRARQLPPGSEALFFGKVTTFRGARQMTNPAVDLLEAVDDEGRGVRTARVVPIYPASDRAGLSSYELSRYAEEALRRAGPLADPLEVGHRQRLGLPDRSSAMVSVHRPKSVEETYPARRRLAFDELLRLQAAVVLRRQALLREARGLRHAVSPDELSGPGVAPRQTLVGRFLAGLPFELTGAQRRALAQVFSDLAGPVPMHRLLQGDVGSGKTVVALAALLVAVQGGHQGALMAPTEVLAEQHHMVVRDLARGLEVEDPGRLGGRRPVEIGLLTNRTGATERRRLTEGLAQGSVDIVVGTHALLVDDVGFASLGVVVIDEQHRFGVEQRAALRDKGRRAAADPDLLVMTATPIPRTAAMVLFGDLDMTVLDERPPGRRPVTTTWARTPHEETAAWAKVREQVAAGRRAFVICPLVEGSERVVARSAVEELERLGASVLQGLDLGLLHGQLPAADKEAAMASFRSGATPVLVATTVVEVGVDVPEATVMVIEDAERFGIAQLHQLRGRVGRGGAESWCFLLGPATSQAAEERLKALEASADGFELAEVDLELRGEGTILGARQKGRGDLKLASLRKHKDLLAAAREVANEVFDAGVESASAQLLAEEVRLVLDDEEEAYLFKS